MNLIGKILTVFILVMSILFSAFAVSVWATHKNWMLVVDNPTGKGLSQQLTEAHDQNNKLVEQRDKLESEIKKEKDRRDKALAQLETENQNLLKERTEAEKKIAQLDASVRDAVMAMKATHEQLANLRGRVQTLSEEIKTAEHKRDEVFKEVVRLTDELHNAVIERSQLQKQTVGLAAELAKAKEALRYFQIDLQTYKMKEPPAGLEGRIVAVPKPDLVEISIGSDDGLREGHNLEVVRLDGTGTNYVGRIVVVKTSFDRAACRVDAKMLRSPIQVNDLVLSKLK